MQKKNEFCKDNEIKNNSCNDNSAFPSFFVSHGGPTLISENNNYVNYLKQFQNTISKPKAIVIFSAHWDSKVQMIGCPKNFETIYDFYGFPDEYYKVKYPAYSDLSLGKEIYNLLANNGIDSKIDESRGLDHGAWTPLYLMFPNPDIPIVSMSINSDAPLDNLYKVGKALEPLKKQGVLILASGALLHNLKKIDFYAVKPTNVAKQFEEWMQKQILSWNTEEIFLYEKKAPYSKEAVGYGQDHFVPLLYAMGTGDSSKKVYLMHQEYIYGAMSYSLYRFD